MHISHLLFTGDVLFLGKWSHGNILKLFQLLNCFHDVSGLIINLHKSSLFGVGVDFAQVQRLATITGCKPENLPFSYLGLPVGSNMACLHG